MNSQSRVQTGAISFHGPRKVISEEPHLEHLVFPIGDGYAKVLRGAQKGCWAELLSQVFREHLT